MFDSLSQKLQGILTKIAGKRTLTEDNISEAASEVRLALLEADVHYAVVKTLVKNIKAKAVGSELIKAVSPGQQFIKLVHDELAALMGTEEKPLNLSPKPAVILLCGLQGAGKTTHVVKLAQYLKKKGLCQKPLIAACDLQRPAAILQLKTLAAQVDLPVFSQEGECDPLKVAKGALEELKKSGSDLLIVDSAGRLHIDQELMAELKALKTLLKPTEILFVANATTGQDAVNSAQEFNQQLEITGTILTMLDGNARGGAAISITEVTGKPLKFEGIGEKIDDLQVFNPSSMADRILGMGDTINLVRRAQEHMDETEAKKLEQKIRSATFTYRDYLNQIQMVRKMGSLKSLLSMMPGAKSLESFDMDDKQLHKIEAIILSMTEDERQEREEMVPSRRRRIAQGSGTHMDDVNKLVKSFKQAKQFFKNMPGMKQMQKMMGGASWR